MSRREFIPSENNATEWLIEKPHILMTKSAALTISAVTVTRFSTEREFGIKIPAYSV
jgi:hypothetical protein